MRLFVSVPVSEEVKAILAQAQDLLRSELAGIDLHLQKLEQSHLTMRFLGEVPEASLPGCRTAVTAAARGASSFMLRTGRLGVFPGPRRPSVLWLGVEGDTEVLEHLHRVLVRHLATRVSPAAESTFRPHLTLCRIRQPLSAADRKRIVGLLSMEAQVPAARWQVRSLQLIHSRLQTGGAVHTVLQDEPLKKGAD